ncbi:hypothetical protein BKA81DRAFT_180720 [Phyllosticta paracitricarpa]
MTNSPPIERMAFSSPGELRANKIRRSTSGALPSLPNSIFPGADPPPRKSNGRRVFSRYFRYASILSNCHNFTTRQLQTPWKPSLSRGQSNARSSLIKRAKRLVPCIRLADCCNSCLWGTGHEPCFRTTIHGLLNTSPRLGSTPVSKICFTRAVLRVIVRSVYLHNDFDQKRLVKTGPTIDEP